MHTFKLHVTRLQILKTKKNKNILGFWHVTSLSTSEAYLFNYYISTFATKKQDRTPLATSLTIYACACSFITWQNVPSCMIIFPCFCIRATLCALIRDNRYNCALTTWGSCIELSECKIPQHRQQTESNIWLQ